MGVWLKFRCLVKIWLKFFWLKLSFTIVAYSFFAFNTQYDINIYFLCVDKYQFINILKSPNLIYNAP